MCVYSNHENSEGKEMCRLTDEDEDLVLRVAKQHGYGEGLQQQATIRHNNQSSVLLSATTRFNKTMRHRVKQRVNQELKQRVKHRVKRGKQIVKKIYK